MDEVEGAKEFLFKLLKVLSQQQIELVASIIWYLWHRRNEQVGEDMEKPLEYSLQDAISSLHEWKRIFVPHISNSLPTETWTKPLEDRYKCNVDGAFFEQESSFGIGMYFRDECLAFIEWPNLVV